MILEVPLSRPSPPPLKMQRQMDDPSGPVAVTASSGWDPESAWGSTMMGDRDITRRAACRRMLLGGCALPFAGAGTRSGVGSDRQQSPGAADLEALLERVRREHDLPGLAAAVVSGARGAISAVTGVRRRRNQATLQLGDRFHIASCTKSWTAMLAAVAVQKERLGWTTTLAEGLPALAKRVRSEYAAATLEQLLAHRDVEGLT